jgi:hypothetical protein
LEYLNRPDDGENITPIKSIESPTTASTAVSENGSVTNSSTGTPARFMDLRDCIFEKDLPDTVKNFSTKNSEKN